MAELRITVGTVSVAAQIDDAVATKRLGLYVEKTGGPVDGTARQKPRWVLQMLIGYVNSVYIN